MRSISRRSPGLLLATGALVLSLAGPASALPGKNSIDKNDIRTAAVNSSDIKNGVVGSLDLAFGSVTADKIGNGQVNSLKLLDGSVTSADVQNDALTGEDVKNDSLTGEDVKDNSLTGSDVNESTLQGVMPAQTRFVTEQTAPVSGAAAGTPAQITANCPAGERAIGGGGAWIIPVLNGGNDPTALDRAFLSASMPSPAQPGTAAASGWTVAGRNVTGTDRILRAYAICVPNQIP